MKEKILSLKGILIIVVIAIVLIGCFCRFGKCEECSQREFLSKYKSDKETEWVCSDCKRLMKAFGL